MIRGMPIQFRTLRLTSVCVERGDLPGFLGATLRGSFGTVFKELACQNARPCSACERPDRCAYGYVFETPIPKDVPGLSAQFAPHPFVLSPASGIDGWGPGAPQRNHFEVGDELAVDLTLVGRAIGLAPAFAQVFAAMGGAGFGADRLRFALARIDVLDLEGNVTASHRDLATLVAQPPVAFSVEEVAKAIPRTPIGEVELRFETPVRLEVKGQPVRRPDAETLVRAALRRLSLLTRLHCQREPEVPYADVIERSRSVKAEHELLDYDERERFSTRKNRSMSLGGVVGKMRLTGELDGLYPWLYLCQFVHLGKGTSFGLGRYRTVVA